MPPLRPWYLIMLFLPLLALLQSAIADTFIPYTNDQGQTIYLDDDRRPALYTQSFGDCLGQSQSLIDVSRFDAELYIDNMTVSFHISGTTSLVKESVMVYIGVYAYGETRFELSWNPCGTNMVSLCPAQAGVPIEVSGIIPLGVSDTSTIPNIAFSIPDFEGQAILRIFANSSQSEITCYAGAVTNGNSFNQEDSIGSILGIFTFVAIVASIATAIYGESIPEMRTHHAHSLSVLVVFAVFHHIYFTGALSMNWPSVLVAWWANFAWASGMVYVPSMQNALTKLVGKYSGNTLLVGAARAGADSSNVVGGGYNIHSIYKRTFATARFLGRSTLPAIFQDEYTELTRRSLANSTSGFKWYGNPVRTGLPLPGNFSGFAGTLSEQKIPAANAFLTGLIWFLILILIIAGSMAIFKFSLEGLYRTKWMKTHRLSYFRQHWMRFTIAAILKACYIAFFMIMFLTIFQFTYDGAPAPIAIAAIVFTLFLVGLFATCGYACYYRLRVGTWVSQPDRILIERNKAFPWFHFHQGYKMQDSEKKFSGSLPGWRLSRNLDENEIPVHEDEVYIRKFGWLSSRFRQSKWWFFALWIVYELIRAVFYAGASGHALVQVFCILIVEIVAFLVIIKLKPFEGQRLNVIMVYLLGFSKVLTVALSAAFDISFNIPRIAATAIGFIIIIIQALVTIALLICIFLSAISSYFSVTRNREQIKPERWMPYRERYFKHINQRATDQPPPVRVVESKLEEPPTPKDPYFSVNSVRRMAKIEDEDAEFQKEIYSDPRAYSDSNIALGDGTTYPAGSSRTGIQRRVSVAHSVHSVRSNISHSSLPYAAALHRGTWSAKDFVEYQAERDQHADRESWSHSRPLSRSSRNILTIPPDDSSQSPGSRAVSSSDASPQEKQEEFPPFKTQAKPRSPTIGVQRSSSVPGRPMVGGRPRTGGSLRSRGGVERIQGSQVS